MKNSNKNIEIVELDKELYRPRTTPKNRKPQKGKMVAITILLVLIAVVGAIVLYVQTKDSNKDPIVTAEGDLPIVGGDVQKGVFTQGMSEEEIQAALQAVADKDNFQLQIVPEMYFKQGDKKGSIIIVNPKNNVYPISVQITMKDGTVLYNSGLIRPEEYIESGLLLKKLPKGFYEALATVTIYSENAKDVQGVTSVDMALTVEN